MEWGGATSSSPTRYAPHSLAAPPPAALRCIARQPYALHSTCLWERPSTNRKPTSGDERRLPVVPQRPDSLGAESRERCESGHQTLEASHTRVPTRGPVRCT